MMNPGSVGFLFIIHPSSFIIFSTGELPFGAARDPGDIAVMLQDDDDGEEVNDDRV